MTIRTLQLFQLQQRLLQTTVEDALFKKTTDLGGARVCVCVWVRFGGVSNPGPKNVRAVGVVSEVDGGGRGRHRARRPSAPEKKLVRPGVANRKAVSVGLAGNTERLSQCRRLRKREGAIERKGWLKSSRVRLRGGGCSRSGT
jgi:hypothetical protein